MLASLVAELAEVQIAARGLNSGSSGSCVAERRGGVFSEPRGVFRSAASAGVCVVMDDGGDLTPLASGIGYETSRALLASNPIERRGGPCFPPGIAALSVDIPSPLF